MSNAQASSLNAQASRLKPQASAKRRIVPLRVDKAARRLWTLRELFEQKFWPYLVREFQAKLGTRQAYLDMLKHWEALTKNPPLAAIRRRTLARFKRRLARQPGRRSATLSARTAVKHWRSLQALLGFAGPASGKRPDALGILRRLPRVRAPSPGKAIVERVTTLDELAAMLRVAARFRYPLGRRGGQLGVRRRDFWTALLLFGYVTSYRIGTLLQLRWSHLDGNLLTVDANLDKVGMADRKRLPDVVMAALERIRPLGIQQAAAQPAGDLIFAWPHGKRYLWACLDKLQEQAGIPRERRAWMKFHGLRKRNAAELTKLGGIEIAQLSLGHTTAATTKGSYVPKEEVTAHYLAALPMPELPSDDLQLWLFD